MIEVRRSGERGHMNHGWLDTYYTFSFDQYFDPEQTGFRSLRVINEDRIQPEAEFPTHPHRDMEIITYLVEGQLSHRDSMGNGSIIRAGEVQRMTAGTGITHSEKNPSTSTVTHLLQIWIFPDRKGLPPGYEQRAFPEDAKLGSWCLVAAPQGQADAVTINQDVYLYASVLKPGDRMEKGLESGRYGWLQVVAGTVDLNGYRLSQGDGASLSDEETVEILAVERSEILLFDLA
ncbi:MAG: pirin family protein [bacterium]|nr:pirin family protein [bacterium]